MFFQINHQPKPSGQNKGYYIMSTTFPRLVADIGGTNARFSVETKPYTYEKTKVYACKEHPTLSAAVAAYLAETKLTGKIHSAALALPTPTVDDTIMMVNSPWKTVSMKKTRDELRRIEVDNVIFLNDFHALALSIPHINKDHLVRLGGLNEPDKSKPIAIIGPGTGLGMATLFKHPLGDYFAIPAEGGRSSFPAVNDEEVELWRFAHKRFSHVSAERFICGPGLQLIYEGLCSIDGKLITSIPTPSEICDLGTSGKDWMCKRTVDIFCRMLGTVTSNLAVMVNSFGGVYIGGGIIPKMLDYFVRSDFRGRFEAKGRYHAFLAKMPIFIITHPFPAFLGTSYALDIYLSKGYIP